jgi:hypothetical protein
MAKPDRVHCDIVADGAKGHSLYQLVRRIAKNGLTSMRSSSGYW